MAVNISEIIVKGCGVPVGSTSGKSGQEIYNENFYGGIFRD